MSPLPVCIARLNRQCRWQRREWSGSCIHKAIYACYERQTKAEQHLELLQSLKNYIVRFQILLNSAPKNLQKLASSILAKYCRYCMINKITKQMLRMLQYQCGRKATLLPQSSWFCSLSFSWDKHAPPDKARYGEADIPTYFRVIAWRNIQDANRSIKWEITLPSGFYLWYENSSS